MKKKNRKIKFSLVLILLMSLIIAGCGSTGGGPNMPYEPDTPAPPNHEGVFVSDHGTMEFNGDGKTVKADFDSELTELIGLSESSFEGTYVFLSGDLPPVGSVDVRYDVAHELELQTENERVVVQVGTAAEDGSTATVGRDQVTPERIPLLFYIDGKNVTIMFNKK